MADMSIGIRCLVADTGVAALPLAVALDRFNRERREVEAAMQDDAQKALAGRNLDAGADNACTLCLFDVDWHQGVVGIVASRLKDLYHRPTIVFAPGGAGEIKGSGRSISGFHLRDALDLIDKRAPGLIAKFGGHAYAAGLSLAAADLQRFATLFEAIAQEQLSPAQLRRTLETDGALGPGELDFALAQALRAEVWGQGFPAPQFEGRFEVADQRQVGDKHAKLTLVRTAAGTPERFSAILFNCADRLPPEIRAVYRPEVNEWNGTAALELVVQYWEPA
jgi:single-stranded-DNA-specific exonuclease